ncbi:MAG TPA: cytochrome C oxidase subunit II [Candidatus Eisenbacteria bacterium]|nr:cytochrome C oxidase subunit II [Candidatus Eisenbacteria bacterium]
MLLKIVPPLASNFAAQNDQLFILITILVGVWFIAAEAMFFWLIFRFRARPNVATQYITGKEKHLHRWVSWPHFLILVCDVVIIIAAVQLWVRVKQTLPAADRTVRVVAQQWAWTFTDPGADGVLDTPDDVRTTDELHLLLNKRYHFLLESKDVLHSFFVPSFRLKQDAIPGRIYTGWFETTRAGTYDILCAEICGIGHGVMGAKLVVEGEAEHATWLQRHAHDAALAALNTVNTAPADTASTPAAPATAGAH